MRFRKTGCLLFASAMVFTAACSNAGQNGPGANTAANESVLKDGGHTAPFQDGKFTEEVTMTAVTHLAASVLFKDGENIGSNVHTRWAKEKLGINLKYLWTTTGPSDAFATKMRLALAANEKMPDVVPIRNPALMHELIDSGKFMDVGPLFDKYASDSWKAAMNEDPAAWYPFMRDGKKYALPILDYTYNSDAVMWIRADWLRKLNLQAPKTLDELDKVLDAFVNQDPDGNGKADTLGLAVGFKDSTTSSMGDLSWLFGAYGKIPRQWNKADDGTLAYGSIEPTVKQGLAKVSDWMKKGYISKEAGLLDADKAAQDFTSGKAGILFAAHWTPGFPFPDLEKNVKGAEYDVYPIPTGPGGKAGRNQTIGVNGALLISKDFQNPDAFFVYQNYMFDHYANPEKGGEFEYGMAEGYDWKMDNGKPRALGGQEGKMPVNKYTLMLEGARIPSLMMKTLEKLSKGGEPSTPFEAMIKEGRDPRLHKAGAVVLQQKDISYPEMFTGAPTKTMKSKWDFLLKTEKETFQKMIYGTLPLDDFDKFVSTWKSSGGDEITKEVNDWYKSVNQK
jgi:putative aldouronate transport system substrate-binding protein